MNAQSKPTLFVPANGLSHPQTANKARREAELGAAPNCGPAKSVASSEIIKGPQSVT
jgi:hypothetical protein